MDCNKANKLMMQFMDNSILEDDYLLLEQHLEECDVCKKDFSLYIEILNGFSGNIGLVEAPEDFEDIVMNRIEDIEPEYIDLKNRFNNFYYVMGGIISLLFSISMLININKELILNNFSSDSIIYKILQFNDYIGILSTSFVEFFMKTISIIEINLPIFLEYLRLTSFIAIIILILAQYRVYKNNRVKA